MNDVNIIGYINSKPNMKQKDGQTTVNFLISPRHKKDTPVEFIPCIVFGKYAESNISTRETWWQSVED